MARLHEHEGKALLLQHGIDVPDGRVVRSADEARSAAAALGGGVVLKVQAWLTGRKAVGGVVFASGPDAHEEAAAVTERLLTLEFGNFPVSEVLIEEVLDIRHEIFVSLSVDDAARAPVLLLDMHGGSGIEGRAASVVRLPVRVTSGIDAADVRRAIEAS